MTICPMQSVRRCSDGCAVTGATPSGPTNRTCLPLVTRNLSMEGFSPRISGHATGILAFSPTRSKNLQRAKPCEIKKAGKPGLVASDGPLPYARNGGFQRQEPIMKPQYLKKLFTASFGRIASQTRHFVSSLSSVLSA